MTISSLIDFLNSTEIALKPTLDYPNEHLAVQAAFFAVHTAKLIREEEKDKVKEAFLVAEYIHSEANPSTERKFEKTYFYCLQAQVDLRAHAWVLDQMPPEMKGRYRKMFNF